MLFVLVMDVLKLLVNQADTNGVLRPLAAYRLKYQVYADDMVLFLQYITVDLTFITESLHRLA